MTQLYVPDKSWLLCSDGMSKQQIKVTSQSTIKIAGGKLAATYIDRPGENFVCGKMLVAGAIIGAAIAALIVSTGGLGFIAAVGAIVGSAAVGIVAGAAIGTLLSLIPCFCALFTCPNTWIGYHKSVHFEKKHALLENAFLMCTLGGKIEIIIFEFIASKRLNTIRQYVLAEALVRGIQVTSFLRAPLRFIFGTTVVNIASELYTGDGSHYLREFVFAMKNPNAAFKNWAPEWSNYKYNIVDNVTRSQLYLQEPISDEKPVHNYPRSEEDKEKLLERKDEEGLDVGTQSNAYRHTVWQATLTNEFDDDTAKKIADSHEDNPNFPYNSEGYNNPEDADKYVDLRNNEIGRRIGRDNPNMALDGLSEKVLDEYNRNGLWEIEKIGDKYFPVLTKLPNDQYGILKDAVSNMNRFGYYDHTIEQVLKELGASDDEIKMVKTIPKAKKQ